METTQTHTELQSRHLEDDVREVDLPKAAGLTWRQVGPSHTRYSARTLVKQPGLRVVLMALERGAHVPEHRAQFAITLQVLGGALRLRVGGDVLELTRGRLVAVERGLPHDLTATEDCEVLLTLGG